jgi:hypothetical protein
MARSEILESWIIEALKAMGSSATVVEVCEQVWRSHEQDLRASGDLFFTWQYDIRWAAQTLRHRGTLRSVQGRRNQPWKLA